MGRPAARRGFGSPTGRAAPPAPLQPPPRRSGTAPTQTALKQGNGKSLAGALRAAVDDRPAAGRGDGPWTAMGGQAAHAPPTARPHFDHSCPARPTTGDGKRAAPRRADSDLWVVTYLRG